MKHKYTKNNANFLQREHKKDPVSEYNSVIAIDKLFCNYLGEIPTTYTSDIIGLKHNSFIEITYSGSQSFRNKDKLYIDNRLIGIIKHNPRQGYIDENFIQIEFDNSLYYNDYLEQAITDVSKLFDYKKISQIEIAYDTNNPVFWDFLQDFKWLKKIKVNNKIDKSSYVENKNRDGETFYFGSPKSDKQFEVYDKSNELLKSKKEYIREFHKKNGLKNTVFRTELKLKGSKKLNRTIDINKIFETSYLRSKLIEHQQGFLEFYKMRKKRNKDETYKYWIPIQVFDFVNHYNNKG